MQKMDEQKRKKILQTAAELFATHPFHKVLLSDVAEAAAVGKGTLYIYFKNKEDLYLSVLYSGFSGLVERLRAQMEEEAHNPEENLEMVIRETVRFAYQNPHLFEVMRRMPAWEAGYRAQWDAKRTELKGLIESIIRRGIRRGIFSDSHPEFTARYIPGFVRAVLLEGIETVDCEVLTEHILHFVRAAIAVKEEAR
ncbi:MAG: TetR/AcrR family transcriptional regulator [Deltaproteobacteria bacterium]